MKRFLCPVVASIILAGVSFAQETDPSAVKPVESPAATQQPPKGQDMGERLVQGLKQIDGCLGVKTCAWDDGKQSIVAWFENKDAVMKWFYDETHQAMVGMVGGLPEDHEPMRHVSDKKDQPIMVIASLTPSNKPTLPGVPMPISQISIELYAPLPGGAQMGGRVAPVKFKVPHMKGYELPAATR